MSKESFPEKSIFVCAGSKCGKHKEIRSYFKDTIKNMGLKDQISVLKIDCLDRCKQAPIVCFQPQNQWFTEMTLGQAHQAFEALVSVKKME